MLVLESRDLKLLFPFFKNTIFFYICTGDKNSASWKRSLQIALAAEHNTVKVYLTQQARRIPTSDTQSLASFIENPQFEKHLPFVKTKGVLLLRFHFRHPFKELQLDAWTNNTLLTESTIEADADIVDKTVAACRILRTEDMVRNFSSSRRDLDIESSPRKLAECRICHDEDEDSNMEMPCSCCGSLKYAHRNCVQKWCNEKGDTTCEICLQQFMPDYTAPAALPPLFHYGAIPMDFRGSWEISRRDLHDSQLIAMVSRDNSSVNTDFDEYSQSTSRSLICCRLVAIIFMLLLVLRHTLPFIVTGSGEYSLTTFTLLMLRTIGILLPIFVMARAFAAVQRRRHLQDIGDFSPATSDEESELPNLQQQQQQPSPHLIQVR